MEVYDLTGNTINSQEETKSDHFSAKEVQGNTTWTQINVIQVRNNFMNGPNGIPGLEQIVIPTSKNKTITSNPDGIPVENTGSDQKLSATSRLTSSIALPLPTNLVYSSSNDWSEEETNFLEKTLGKIADGGIQSVADATGNIADYAKNKLVGMASMTAFKKFTQNQGFASNPYKEVYYGGIRFRTFAWHWELAPKSEKEAQSIERLLYNLELASHPEFTGETDSSAFWIPDSFEVEFKGTNLPKLQRLVLTSMSTDYSQYGPKFVGGGYPSFVSLDLNFMEVDIRTKKEVREAYQGRNIPDLF